MLRTVAEHASAARFTDCRPGKSEIAMSLARRLKLWPSVGAWCQYYWLSARHRSVALCMSVDRLDAREQLRSFIADTPLYFAEGLSTCALFV